MIFQTRILSSIVRSINSWIYLCNNFIINFTTQIRKLVTTSFLNGIIRGKKENLRSYIDHFMQVVMEIIGSKEGLNC